MFPQPPTKVIDHAPSPVPAPVPSPGPPAPVPSPGPSAAPSPVPAPVPVPETTPAPFSAHFNKVGSLSLANLKKLDKQQPKASSEDRVVNALLKSKNEDWNRAREARKEKSTSAKKGNLFIF